MITSKQAILYSILTLLIGAALGLAGSQNSLEVYGYPLFAIAGTWAFGLQFIVFLPSFLAKTEHFYDLTGSLTYISICLLCLYALPTISITQWVLASMVLFWSIRLGAFLFWRVHKFGGDDRFEKMKTRFFNFLMAWIIQGLWVYLTMAAALAALTSKNSSAISALEITGILIWLFGLSVEITADLQKTIFKLKQENKGKFIQTGLWSWSRHPNYFGEIVLWSGVALTALESLSGWQLATLISPVFVFILLTKVSGVPMLEEKAEKKWGKEESFIRYKESTSKLILWPPRQKVSE